MDCINSFDIRLEKDGWCPPPQFGDPIKIHLFAVFYPGEQLNGVVLIESIAPIKLRGAFWEFLCKGLKNWQSGDSDNSHGKVVFF